MGSDVLGRAAVTDDEALAFAMDLDACGVPASAAPASFDYLHPEYAPIWSARVKLLAKLQADPVALAAVKLHYKHNVADFINDWGVTVNPKNAGTDRPVIMPFVLFPKQREFIDWFIARWKGRQNGVLVKSRECGASWLAMAISSTLCLFWDDISIGFGSAKEEKVDRSGDPDTLFYKGRTFVQYVPALFKGGWDIKRNSAHMRMTFPNTGSSITGDAGDNIGVGGRKTIYVVDEYAIVERPKLVEANLSANTDTRIEMSTVRGLDNTFAEHARSGKVPRFDFLYLDDPTKTNLGPEYETDAHDEHEVVKHWIVKTGDLHPAFAVKKALMDEVIFNQEYGCDFFASIEGGVIEQAWIQSALGAAEKLGIKPTGARMASFDVADLGNDKNAVSIRHGIELVHCEAWSGSNINPMASIRRAFEICDKYGVRDLIYDASGMGGSWHEYFKIANDERKTNGQKPIVCRKFQGGGAVIDPERKAPGSDRKNIDYFENLKAQSWMSLRQRFAEVHKAVTGEKYDASNIISIPVNIANKNQLISELAQPTRKWSKAGKLMIEKCPDGVASPNIADSVMQEFGYSRPPMVFHEELFEMI